MCEGGADDEIEERFLELYAHLHMNEAPYTIEERQRMDAAGGYWNHAGGLIPIRKAAPWIDGSTVSADFGAGNGVQGLLLQVLYPHRKTVQIEIAEKMSEIADCLRAFLSERYGVFFSDGHLTCFKSRESGNDHSFQF